MLRKMLSMLLVILMFTCASITMVSAKESEDVPSENTASFDEAYAYLKSVIEATEGADNKAYFTETSYEAYLTARMNAGMAHINAGEDMYTAEDFLYYADELQKAYDNLEGLVFGDVDGDRDVNVKDATEIQKYLVALVELSDGRLLCADVNGDKVHNIRDATYIQKFAAEIITTKDNKALNQEFYVLELKEQLSDLMNQGKESTQDKKYEAESFDIYLSAQTCASEVLESESVKHTEVKKAILNLCDAINGLVPEIELPLIYDPDYKCIYEFRVGTYEGSYDLLNIVVHNTEELQAVVDKIDAGFFVDEEDLLPEEYDDAYFEENDLILSFCVVGGSGCSQWVYRLTVDGTALIIRRAISRPEIYPPDMNYSLSYLEIKKLDMKRITMIINEIDGEFAGSSEL